jgi:hypothetical protein
MSAKGPSKQVLVGAFILGAGVAVLLVMKLLYDYSSISRDYIGAGDMLGIGLMVFAIYLGATKRTVIGDAN